MKISYLESASGMLRDECISELPNFEFPHFHLPVAKIKPSIEHLNVHKPAGLWVFVGGGVGVRLSGFLNQENKEKQDTINWNQIEIVLI